MTTTNQNTLRVKQWRIDNPEKYREIVRRHNKKSKVAKSKWEDKNKEKVAAYSRKWQKAHPETMRIYAQNRRANKTLNGGVISTDIESQLFKKQNGKCPCCGLSLGNDYHLDHIMPLALGGRNEDANLQLLRKGCNLAKSFKHPVEYMQSRGFLL